MFQTCMYLHHIMNKLLIFLSIFFVLQACKTEKKYTAVNSLADIKTNLSEPEQQSEIDASKDNLITGEKGTKIFLPANSLVFADGSIPKSTVQINFSECYSTKDFLANNLSTTSHSYLLETGGMIHISARADGKELFVSADKSLSIAFPKKDTSGTMEIFYGERDSSGMMNWISPARGELGLSSEFRNDSSLYKNQLKVCAWGWTGDFDWQINDPNSDFVSYINNQFETNNSLVTDTCINGYAGEVNFKLDANGKIINVRFDSISVKLQSLISSIFDNAPAFQRLNKISGYSEDLYMKFCCHKEFDKEKYEAKFKQKYSQYRDKAVEKIDPAELNYYILSTSKLGWINCDRFYELKVEKTDFIVTTPQTKETNVQIVFMDIRSAMQGEAHLNGFIFRNVPVGSKVNVIGLGYNGKPGMSISQTIISGKEYQLPQLREYTIEKLDEELGKLN